MRPIANWEKVKPATDRVPLPKGGYVLRIMGAKVKEHTKKDNSGSFEKLEISFDIEEGDFKGHFAEDYRSQQYEDKRWKGVLSLYLPTEEEDENSWSSRKVRATTDAIEDSNPGYHWDWNEAGLKGKLVGGIFQLQEWSFNGRNGWTARCCKFVPVDSIRQADYIVPDDKPLKNGSSAAPSSTSSYTQVEEEDPDDLPF